MSAHKTNETVPRGFDDQGWPLPEVRSLMIDNFARSWLNHKIAVVVLFIAAAGLTLFGAWLVTPTWEGYGQIEVLPTPTPSLTIEESVVKEAPPLTAGQIVKNLVENAKSYSFLKEVRDRSGLAAHLEQRAKSKKNIRERVKRGIVYVAKLQFLRPGGPVNYEAKALDELTSSWVRIAPSEGSTVLPVYVYGDQPDITIQVGNAIMDLMQERTDASLRVKVNQQIDTVKQLQAQAAERVAENDAKIQALRTSYEFFDPKSYAADVQSSLNSLYQEKTVFQSRDDSLVAEIQILEEQLKQVPEILKLAREGEGLKPDMLLSTSLKRDIAQLEADIASKKAAMGANAPQIAGLEAQLGKLKQSLEEAQREEAQVSTSSSNVSESLDPRYQASYNRLIEAQIQRAALAARYAGLDRAIEVLREMSAKAVQADSELSLLEREAQAAYVGYQSISTRLRELENLAAQPTLFTGIVSRSDMMVKNPNNPDNPNNLLALILAIMIGLFAALVLPIAYDYLNQTLLTSRQASTIPGLRVVAAVPKGRHAKLFSST